jgi:hypothetical protein
MLRRGLSVAGGGGFVTAIFAAGWAGIVIVSAVVVVLIAAVCWIVADEDRPARVALLVTAWRHGTITPRRRRTPAVQRRLSAVESRPAPER